LFISEIVHTEDSFLLKLYYKFNFATEPLIIFGVPTGYFVWNFISVVDDWDRIMHANDIFMYMGLFSTLPLMVTVELYVVAFIITKNLFKKKKKK
jgi:hypothetical protein